MSWSNREEKKNPGLLITVKPIAPPLSIYHRRHTHTKILRFMFQTETVSERGERFFFSLDSPLF